MRRNKQVVTHEFRLHDAIVVGPDERLVLFTDGDITAEEADHIRQVCERRIGADRVLIAAGFTHVVKVR